MPEIKKIISTIVLITMLLTASTIYASGIPQNSLSKWYGQSFQKEREVKRSTISSDIIQTFEEVNIFLLESILSYESTIEGIQDKQLDKTRAGIGRYQHDIKSRLNQTVTELQKVNFNDYAEIANIEEEIDQNIEEVLKEVFGN